MKALGSRRLIVLISSGGGGAGSGRFRGGGGELRSGVIISGRLQQKHSLAQFHTVSDTFTQSPTMAPNFAQFGPVSHSFAPATRYFDRHRRFPSMRLDSPLPNQLGMRIWSHREWSPTAEAVIHMVSHSLQSRTVAPNFAQLRPVSPSFAPASRCFDRHRRFPSMRLDSPLPN